MDTDKDILNSIGLQFFNNAHKWAKSGNTQHLRILKFDTHISFVEPFFSTNALQSRKQFDFLIWQEILQLMKNKVHLTSEGISQIRKLQSLQNILRTSFNHEIQDILTKNSY